MCNNSSLWLSYQTILFRSGQQPDFPYFAILTAFNPESKPLSDAENLKRNAELIKEMQQSNITFVALNGGAPDGSWFEPGFAVFLPLDKAKKLASKWGQNAIYWVEGDDVYLEPVLMEGYQRLCLPEPFTVLFTVE